MDIFNVLRINNVPFEDLVNKDVDTYVDETLDKNSKHMLKNKSIYDLTYRIYQLIRKTGYIDEYLDNVFYGNYIITYLSNGKIRLNDNEIDENKLIQYINTSNKLTIKNERIEDVNIDYILSLNNLQYCECISDNLKIQTNSINILPNLKTLIIPNSSISNVSSINCSSHLKFCCTVNAKNDLPEIESSFNNINFTNQQPIKYYGLSNDGETEIILNDLNYENMYINLKNFRFYDSVGNAAIKNVILSNSGNITNLSNNCFRNCSNLPSIDIPTSVSNLGDACFRDCSNLLSVDIPTSVTNLSGSCFEDSKKLSSINIPTSVVNLGNGCFYHSSGLVSIDIPTSVTNVGENCFNSCTSLTLVNIPTSVKILRSGCFYECTSLSSIDIPTSMTELSRYCFQKCSNLSTITIPTSIATIGTSCFSSVNSNIHFNILASSVLEANPVGKLIKSRSSAPSTSKYYYYDENNDTWTEFIPS